MEGLNPRSTRRVVLLGPSAERYKGGIAQFTSRLAAELGKQTELEFFSWAEMYPRFLLKREFRDTVSSERTSGPPAKFILSYVNPLSWLKLARAIRRFDPDLIFLTWSHPVHAPVYLCLKWLLGRRLSVQFICHNVLPHEPFTGARLLTRWCFRGCERLIVHGSSEAAAIAALPAPGPDILELFLPLHDFFGERRPRRTSGHELLFFGHIRPYKGLDVLLRAMPLVRRQIPDVRLRIAGEMFYTGSADSADERSNPLALIDKLGISDCVDCDIRYIPNEQIAKLMAQADACVFPYRSATQSGGITLAYAYGVPVVSTRVGGIPDVVAEGQSGLLVEPDDVEALADALISILDNPIPPESVDQVAGNLSWDRYVSELLSEESTPNTQTAVGHFLLTGTYNTGNKGDAAMELAAARNVLRRFPDSHVTILSPFAEMDRPFYAPVPVEFCNRRQLITASFDLLRALAWRLLGFDWLLSPLSKRVRDADLVIDLSGDMLTDDYGPHVAYSHYIPLLRALILDRSYVVCAQSIGPFRATRALARLVLNHAAAITTRDAISTATLKRLGVRCPRVEETADLAFLLEPAPASRAEAILDAEGVSLDDRPLIGVSVSQLIERKYSARNPAGRGGSFSSMLAEILERIARARDARVMLVAHVTGPGRTKDDRIAARRVRDLIAPDLDTIVLDGDYRPDELKAVIGRSAVFVGARMHANIAALSSSVPTVALAYSHKTPGIMQSLGVGKLVAPIESVTAESLEALITAALDERETLSRDLGKSLERVTTKAARNFELIGEIVDAASEATQ